MRTSTCARALSVIALLVSLLAACRTNTPTPVPPPTGVKPAPAPIAEPGWWNDVVFYEVFVRSFYDSDGDGNGDLTGVIEKLDYLNDGDPATRNDLGIGALWLMPVMQSPSYHGYDVVDYYMVEEDYGTNEDFRALVREAHAREMRVVVDLVLNHTSSEHPWFVDAGQGPQAEHRDWYIWSKENPGFTGPWGERVWHRHDGVFYYGIFWEGMPDLNYRNSDVSEAARDVSRFWLEEMRVDGFRLDAVQHLIEDGQNQAGTPQTHAWLADFDDFTDDLGAEVLTVGEVWATTREVAPYVVNDEVDLAFEFDLAGAIVAAVESGDPSWFGYVLQQVEASYPRHQYATFLTNHDQDRVTSQLRGDPEGARLAATVLLTLPGVPFIYYGEEIGMTGQKPDPTIRTPMQWTPGEHAGFTGSEPWQPVNAGFDTVNVETESADPGSLLNHYRRLIHLRNDHLALRQGALVPLESSCDVIYGFLRQSTPERPEQAGAESVLVVLNFSGGEEQDCTFALSESELMPGVYEALDLLTDATFSALTVEEGGAFHDYLPLDRVAPQQGYVLLLMKTEP